MKSKDRRCAVLAVIVALPFCVGIGSAKATDAPQAASVGVGIDYTMPVRVENARVEHARAGASHGRLGAADAIDLLARPVAQPLPTRQPVQGATHIGSLRGLLVPNALDAARLERPSGSAEDRLPLDRPSKGPKPYFRFSEEERVLGLSFKIQPPPQPTDAPLPGS